MDGDEVARSILGQDRAQPAITRADDVGEERKEAVAVHLVEVAAQGGRGDERPPARREPKRSRWNFCRRNNREPKGNL